MGLKRMVIDLEKNRSFRRAAMGNEKGSQEEVSSNIVE